MSLIENNLTILFRYINFYCDNHMECIRTFCELNPLKTKRRLFYLKTHFVPRSKHFQLGYKNQPVYDISGTSRCLFSDKYKTRKYSVGRAYSC